jgi:hypothetical protein
VGIKMAELIWLEVILRSSTPLSSEAHDVKSSSTQIKSLAFTMREKAGKFSILEIIVKKATVQINAVEKA